jgi:hypothetical protein
LNVLAREFHGVPHSNFAPESLHDLRPARFLDAEIVSKLLGRIGANLRALLGEALLHVRSIQDSL